MNSSFSSSPSEPLKHASSSKVCTLSGVKPLPRALAAGFCQMAKGTHVVQADYYVDRVGEYLSGIVTAECAYANEFRGTQGAYHIQIKK